MTTSKHSYGSALAGAESINLPDLRFDTEGNLLLLIAEEPLSRELSTEDVAELAADLDICDVLQHVVVSAEVAAECRAELEAGRKSGWMIPRK